LHEEYRDADPDPSIQTLATTVRCLLDQLEDSALPALTIVAAGLIPVILLSRSLRDSKASA
jgi:hypothetical protein